MRTRHPFVTVVAVAAVVFLVVVGVWPLVAPANFYQHVALFPPYNRHFLHDVGAFTLGLAVTLSLALWLSDALFVALAGVAAGSVLHAISHIVDRGIGGRSSDPWSLSVLALVIAAAAAVRWKEIAHGAARQADRLRKDLPPGAEPAGARPAAPAGEEPADAARGGGVRDR